MAAIVIDPVTFSRAEEAWRRLAAAQRNQDLGFAEVGLRTARARDPRMLAALEQFAEVLERAHEEQRGETKRLTREHAQSVDAQPVQAVREAYKAVVDVGYDPRMLRAFQWIYGAAAWLAGLRY